MQTGRLDCTFLAANTEDLPPWDGRTVARKRCSGPMTTTSVLWLYGPAGVGKTTAGWEIFSRLTHSGVAAAFVDIDQLGMCYPEQPSDPGRHRLQARNLAAVVGNFAAAGARSVIVAGVVDPARGVPADVIPGAALMSCRMRADAAELRRRFVERSGNHADPEAIDDLLREAAALDANNGAGLCVDTSTMPAVAVADDVVRRCGGWLALIGPRRDAAQARMADLPASTTAMPVLFLCGATGVGKSTVGFEIYMGDLNAGRAAAYIDLDQIGFCSPATAADESHAVKAANLAAICANYETAGARQLIAVGPVESVQAAATYAAALPAADMTLCRLHAGRDELQLRISQRGGGGSWPQPGDPLVGQSPGHLRRVAEQAAQDAEELDRASIGDLRVDTNGHAVSAIADLIVSKAGWRGHEGYRHQP
jgi:adenylylsulfate kinase-like enzyme